MRKAALGALVLMLCAGSLFAQVGIETGGVGAGAALGGGVGGTAQNAGANQLVTSPQGNALLASTTADYPVTPGDTFSLTFLQSTQPATMRLFVDTDGGINAGVFGHIDGRGLSYPALKAQIERLVSQGYPGSNPSLQIVATGLFTVKVDGEVNKAELKTAWGLTRLSEIVGAAATAYADRRSVLVRGTKGDERHFDLFKASRDGDLSSDPYVRPGDTVVLAKAARIVSVGGAVFRPGSYQLLANEGIGELIKRYGDGLRDDAQPAFANLTRRAGSESTKGESIVFDARFPKGSTAPALFDGDSVFVPTRESYLPVVYFEGAITTGDVLAAQAAGNTKSTAANDSGGASQVSVRVYGQSRTTYKPGDLLSQAIRVIAPNIQANADLRNAFIARKGQADSIPVDLEKLLYAYDAKDDFLLEPEDRIVIPFGSLDIFVTGEVKKSSWVSSGALTRLSAVIGPSLTPYSSIRDVTVRSADGEKKKYDLFKADRNGDLSNDPFLKPGDLVIIHKLLRSVTIGGEVKYPGTYQLFPGEQLKDVIEYYAGGLTGKANLQRISLGRDPKPGLPLGQLSYIDYGKDPGFVLRNLDSIVVPSVSELLPVAYFEGAIGVPAAAGAEGKPLDAANRIPHVFVPGEMLSQAVQSLRGGFTATSDLAHAYIVRDGIRIAVNIADLIYKNDFTQDHALVANDTVIIPFRQYFVTVAGAVRAPGRYPYVPDRSYQYYVNLAGGHDSDKSTGRSLTINSVDGRKKDLSKNLEPEDRIYVNDDDFIYNMGKVLAIVGNLASVISVAYTAYSLLPKH